MLRVAQQMKIFMAQYPFNKGLGIFTCAPGVTVALRLTPEVHCGSALSTGRSAGESKVYVGITMFFSRATSVSRSGLRTIMTTVVKVACDTFNCRQNVFVNAPVLTPGAPACKLADYGQRRRDFIDCFGFNVMSAAERLTVAPGKPAGDGSSGLLTSREFTCYKCGKSKRACHFPIQNMYYGHVRVDIFYEILAGRHFTGYEQACDDCTDACTLVSCSTVPLVTRPHPMYTAPSEALILCPGCRMHKGVYHFKAPTADTVGQTDLYWYYIANCQQSGTQRVCDACTRAHATRKMVTW